MKKRYIQSNENFKISKFVEIFYFIFDKIIKRIIQSCQICHIVNALWFINILNSNIVIVHL